MEPAIGKMVCLIQTLHPSWNKRTLLPLPHVARICLCGYKPLRNLEMGVALQARDRILALEVFI